MDAFTTSLPEISNATVSENMQKAISFRPFGITIAIWSILIGSIGNLLTILTYVSNVKLRTTFNLFLVNLAVIDFWTAAGMLPFNLAGYVQMKWPLSQSPMTARLQAFQYFCCGYTSVVFLVAITVNRYVGVLFPAKYHQLYSTSRTIIILIVCNLFAPIFLLPFLVGTDESCTTPYHAFTGFHPGQFLCTFICLPIGGWTLYMQFIRVVFQFVPLIVMMILYSVIFTSVKRKRDAVSVRLGLNGSVYRSNTVNVKNVNGRKKRSEQEERRQKEDSRMALLSVTICIAFMVTFLPSVVINLLPNRYELDPRWHMAASNLTWFNSSVNPIIYVLLNRRFRREYWRIVKFGFGSVKGRFIHESSSQYSAAAATRKPSNAGNSTSASEAARTAIRVE